MLVFGLSEEEVAKAVAKASHEYFDDNLRFRKEPYPRGLGLGFSLRCVRTGRPGNKVSARRDILACTHAFSRVAQVILRDYPFARVQITGMGDFSYSKLPLLAPSNLENLVDVVKCYCPQHLLDKP